MPDTAGSQAWYRSLSRDQWKTLLAANLGWLFDGFETFALILAVGPAMQGLLDPSQHTQIPAYIGTVIALTLLGWGVGGMLGGILADYVGRKRTMILAIMAYSIMTGLSAMAFDWVSFLALRFLVGIAIGAEWSTGTAMMAEVWPDEARGKGAGLMQCGIGVGFFLASFVWLFVGPIGPDSWRYMFLIGVLPALLALWIRTSLPESGTGQRTDESAADRLRRGAPPAAGDPALPRSTMMDLFVRREIRRRTIIMYMMSLATTLGWWAISSWIPPYVGLMASKAGLPPQQWMSYAGMAYNFGAIVGYVSLGYLADHFGRKPVTLLFFAASLLMTPVVFLWTQDLRLLLLAIAANGFFTLGQYSWMPAWMPELFPTHLRATGIAFVFNAPRFIAFAGPLVAGSLIVQFGGFGHAAMIFSTVYAVGFLAALLLPETRGKPLPDRV
jgi:MFS family permease